MKQDEDRRASTQLKKSNAAVGAAFSDFRHMVRAAGPLDKQVVEFILMAGFFAGGHEVPFKNHAMRALKSGVAMEALQQLVMVTLGATSVLPAVADGLRWLDEVYKEYAGEK